nr:nucleoside hydrolase [Agrobacterium tumefaciens]
MTLSGAWGLGSKTASAEWNVFCDPEAASIVYGAGIPLTMVPIDDALIASVGQLPGPTAKLATELLKSLTTTFYPGVLTPEKTPSHDPCAILAAAYPEIVKTVPARVEIETAPGLNYGRSMVDVAGRTGKPDNCRVVIAFDIAATHRRLVESLGNLARLQETVATS